MNVDDLVFLGDAKGILFFLGAWGAHQDDTLGSARGISVLKLKNAVDLLNDAHLVSRALKLGDEALADVLDTSDLQVVLQNSIPCDSLPLLRVDVPGQATLLTLKVAEDGVIGLGIALVQHDELVRDDTHLLKCDGLRLRSGETLNDPALLSCFHKFNLLLDKFDHDLVLDVTVRFKRLLDVLTILLVFLGDLARDQVTDRDALEVVAFLGEMRGEAECDLLSLAAWGSDKDNTSS